MDSMVKVWELLYVVAKRFDVESSVHQRQNCLGATCGCPASYSFNQKMVVENGVVRLISDEAVMDLVKEVTKDDVLTLLVHF